MIITRLSPDREKLLEIYYSYLLDKANPQGSLFSLRKVLYDIAVEIAAGNS